MSRASKSVVCHYSCCFLLFLCISRLVLVVEAFQPAHIGRYIPTLAALTTANRKELRTLTLVDAETHEIVGQCREWAALPEELNKPDEDEVELLYPTTLQFFDFGDGNPHEQLVRVRSTSFGCGKLGYEVWPTGLALSLYLGRLLRDRERLSILELGAGCGLPSIICRDAPQVSSIVASDFWYESAEAEFDKDRLVPETYHGINLQYNVLSDDSGSTRRSFVERLDWNDLDTVQDAVDVATGVTGQLDIVIGSDLIYHGMNGQPLWQTMEALLNSSQERAPTIVIFSPLEPFVREGLPEFRSMLETKCDTDNYNLHQQEFILYRSLKDLENRQNAERFLKTVVSVS